MNSPRIREVLNHGKPQWLVDIPASMTAKRKRLCLDVVGGLRPDEAGRIAWEDIREGFVHIEGVKARTRRRRLVPISD